MTDQHPGRPPHPPDDGCQVLEKQLLEAKREIELLNHKMALKDVLMDLKLPETGCDRAKKNDRIQQAMTMIETVKTKFSMSYTHLAGQVGRYRTLMRWKRRLANGKDPGEKRGPKKVHPLNLRELNELVRQARDESNHHHQAETCYISWLQPNLALDHRRLPEK